MPGGLFCLPRGDRNRTLQVPFGISGLFHLGQEKGELGRLVEGGGGAAVLGWLG